MAQKWTAEEHSYLKELVSNADKNNWKAFALSICQKFNKPFSYEQVRAYWRLNIRNTGGVIKPNYSETVEILSNGSVKSDKLIELSLEQAKDQQYILEAHGFDAKEWEVVSAKSSQWNHQNKELGTSTMYSSKVTVKPKPKEITELDVVEIFRDVKPRHIQLSVEEILEEYLYIPLADMHIGLNTLLDYIYMQSDIAEIIRNGYEEIVISLNGDYFHVDNFLNTTEKGTRLNDVDAKQSVEDGYNFLIPLIELALANCPNVKLIYLPGNHAPSIDYMFVQGIKRLYPQVTVDDEVEEVKHTWLGDCSLFLHHGDKIKNVKRLHEVATSKFAKEWGVSESRYLITAHLHHEKSLSFGGLTHYQLQSPSKPSSYDKDYGFDTSEEGVMLFEFDKHKRKAIYYL